MISTQVVEQDHTLVLGYSENLRPLIAQVALANESETFSLGLISAYGNASRRLEAGAAKELEKSAAAMVPPSVFQHPENFRTFQRSRMFEVQNFESKNSEIEA